MSNLLKTIINDPTIFNELTVAEKQQVFIEIEKSNKKLLQNAETSYEHLRKVIISLVTLSELSNKIIENLQ